MDPVVSLAEPSTTLLLPVPASEPIAWLKLLRLRREPPALTVWALLEDQAFAAPARKVPVTVVAPE